MTELAFIDICAGIGGFRSGLERAGMKCVGYIERDKYARKSYEAMYDTENEWSAEDVENVKPEELPNADVWCFGFPCQDVSVAGKRIGLDGKRSGIFYSIIRLIKSKKAEDRPEWLLIENVKNLLSINGGRDFTRVLLEISDAGYDAEYAVLNSKDFGVPQNRERVFIIGHLRDRGRQEVLSRSRENRQTGEESKINKIVKSTQNLSVVDSNGINPTISACDYKDPQKVAIPKLNQMIDGSQSDRVYNSNGVSRTIASCAGGGGAKTGYYAVPCIDPCREKNQNGRIFKENGDPMFTLTGQDRHGVLLYDDKEYYIRKLTPKECFRLQGFTDEQFEKARVVNSDSQLYKQAGNAVTVNVVEYLGNLIKESYNDENL